MSQSRPRSAGPGRLDVIDRSVSRDATARPQTAGRKRPELAAAFPSAVPPAAEVCAAAADDSGRFAVVFNHSAPSSGVEALPPPPPPPPPDNGFYGFPGESVPQQRGVVAAAVAVDADMDASLDGMGVPDAMAHVQRVSQGRTAVAKPRVRVSRAKRRLVRLETGWNGRFCSDPAEPDRARTVGDLSRTYGNEGRSGAAARDTQVVRTTRDILRSRRQRPRSAAWARDSSSAGGGQDTGAQRTRPHTASGERPQRRVVIEPGGRIRAHSRPRGQQRPSTAPRKRANKQTRMRSRAERVVVSDGSESQEPATGSAPAFERSPQEPRGRASPTLASQVGAAVEGVQQGDGDSVGGQVALGLRSGRSYSDVNAMAVSDQGVTGSEGHHAIDAASAEHYFDHVVTRLRELWAQLHVPQRDRTFFANAYCREANPGNVGRLDAQMSLLLDHKATTIKLLQCIEFREGAVRSLCHVCTDVVASMQQRPQQAIDASQIVTGGARRRSRKKMSRDDSSLSGAQQRPRPASRTRQRPRSAPRHRIAKVHGSETQPEGLLPHELNDVAAAHHEQWRNSVLQALRKVQVSTLAVVEGVLRWRRHFWRSHPFIWKGVNCLLRVLHEGGWRDPWVTFQLPATNGTHATDTSVKEQKALKRRLIAEEKARMHEHGATSMLADLCKGTVGRVLGQLKIPVSCFTLVVAPRLAERVCDPLQEDGATLNESASASLLSSFSRSLDYGVKTQDKLRHAEQYLTQEWEEQRKLQVEQERLLARGFYIPMLRWSPGDSFGDQEKDPESGVRSDSEPGLAIRALASDEATSGITSALEHLARPTAKQHSGGAADAEGGVASSDQ